MDRDSKPKLITPSVNPTQPAEQSPVETSNAAPPLIQQPQVAGLNGAPPGGGSKHWLIMGILGGLIIAGIVLLATMKDDQTEANDEKAKAAAEAEAAKNYKPEKRPSVSTEERPFKKEMAKVSVNEIDSITSNLKKWVFLEGKVKTSDENGLITFERALGQRWPFEAQLVRGSAPEVEGKEITVIGWLIDKGHMQIDGPEDVDVELPEVSRGSGFDLYSVNDFELLKEKVNTKLTLQGKVKRVRYSHDEEKVYLEFEAGENDVLASGVVARFEEGLTFEELKKHEGKIVTVRGVLGEQSWNDKYRLYVNFSRFRHINVIE